MRKRLDRGVLGGGLALVLVLAGIAPSTAAPLQRLRPIYGQPGAGPAPMPLPAPCHGNSTVDLELANSACSGGPDGVLTLYVSRAGLRVRPTVAVFRAGAIGRMRFNPADLPSPNAQLQQPLTLIRGDGLAPGSLYAVRIPRGACMFGGRHIWNWDIFVPLGSTLQDVDVVAVRC